MMPTAPAAAPILLAGSVPLAAPAPVAAPVPPGEQPTG
jgi:hypothetical protein